MKFASVNMNQMKILAGKTYVKLRKISPELALGGAILCGIGAVVAGCLASRHVDEVIDDAQDELNEILEESNENVDVNVQRESLNCYVHTGLRLIKLYAPTILLGSASIALMLTSHGILNRRYVNTTAAYAALSEAFTAYRARVRDIIGDEAEKMVLTNGKMEKNIHVENDDGSISEQSGDSFVINENSKSPYEFDFNRHTAPLTWSPNPDYSEAYLRNIQNYFNDLLQTRGHVFLNEVLDQIGLKRTPAGAVCGWVRGCGDDYIDFGYIDSFMRDYKIDSDLCRKNIHLNFNCDGAIWNMI